MALQATVADLLRLRSADLGVTVWRTIEQREIDLFAEVTGDHQWIHVDQDAARSGPFGRTVAHGYLTPSLVPELLDSLLGSVDQQVCGLIA